MQAQSGLNLSSDAGPTSSDKHNCDTSSTVVRPLTENLLPAVREFNSRLDAAGS
jgi:hypothetical protein